MKSILVPLFLSTALFIATSSFAGNSAPTDQTAEVVNTVGVSSSNSKVIYAKLDAMEEVLQRIAALCQQYCETISTTNTLPEGFAVDLASLKKEGVVENPTVIQLINVDIANLKKVNTSPPTLDIKYADKRSLLDGDDIGASRLGFEKIAEEISSYTVSYARELRSFKMAAATWKEVQKAHVKMLFIQKNFDETMRAAPTQFSQALLSSGYLKKENMQLLADALRHRVSAVQSILEHHERAITEMRKVLDVVTPWMPSILMATQGNRTEVALTIPVDTKGNLASANNLILFADSINSPTEAAFNIEQALKNMRVQNQQVRETANQLWREANLKDAEAALTSLDLLKEGIDHTVSELAKGLENARKISKQIAVEAVNAQKTIIDASVEITKKSLKESLNATINIIEIIKTGEAKGDIAIGWTKASEDAFKTLVKAHEDSRKEAGRAGENLEELVSAMGHFIEDEFHSSKQLVSDAEKRLREGKVIDALWHMGTDPLKATSKNAGTAATKSAYLNAVASTAASVYGGPYGAAAYAAWLTYEQTGDLELALKNGIISGANSWASGKVGKIPSDVKRVITSAVLGGVAVAVSGGSEEDILKGAYTSAGVVVLQVGYKEFTKHKFDPSSSKGLPICKKCPPGHKYRGPDYAYKDDILDERLLSDIDAKRPQVGISYGLNEAGKKVETGYFLENSKPMIAVSKFPVMNAMALGHDIGMNAIEAAGLSGLALKIVSISTIIPAIIVSYTAAGAPIYTLLPDVSIKKFREDEARSAESTLNSKTDER